VRNARYKRSAALAILRKVAPKNYREHPTGRVNMMIFEFITVRSAQTWNVAPEENWVINCALPCPAMTIAKRASKSVARRNGFMLDLHRVRVSLRLSRLLKP
jgi:hypothetical protein